MQNNPQPIFILPESSKRTSGKDAQRNNIAAAKAVAQAIRTTLGPKGMDKMLVDHADEVTVTNDGVTILKEMHVAHPAAKMVVEIAKTQETEVGDGTTTAVILAGELLNQAEQLLDQNLHPALLAKGYRKAEAAAQKILQQIAQPVTLQDTTTLQKIAITAMTGKGADTAKEQLAKLIVEAIHHIADPLPNADNIKIQTTTGNLPPELITGIVLDKERVHPGMPETLTDTKIALINCPLEIKNTEIDAKISITSPSQMQSFLDQEEQMLRTIIDHIKQTGATVIFCQKGIDELAQHFLAKAGILAARRVRKTDMEKLSRATSGKIINNWKDLTSEDLGTAGKVSTRTLNSEELIFVENCPSPKAVTLLLSAGTQHVVDELERAVTDALGDIIAAVKEGKIVAGAGSTETRLAIALRDVAKQHIGREQLAINAFATALEIIPRTLAENAGLDPLDILTSIRSSQITWPGINAFNGTIMDAWTAGVIEPLKVKTQALSAATQVAELILRIDDVILTSPPENNPQPLQ